MLLTAERALAPGSPPAPPCSGCRCSWPAGQLTWGPFSLKAVKSLHQITLELLFRPPGSDRTHSSLMKNACTPSHLLGGAHPSGSLPPLLSLHSLPKLCPQLESFCLRRACVWWQPGSLCPPLLSYLGHSAKCARSPWSAPACACFHGAYGPSCVLLCASNYVLFVSFT